MFRVSKHPERGKCEEEGQLHPRSGLWAHLALPARGPASVTQGLSRQGGFGRTLLRLLRGRPNLCSITRARKHGAIRRGEGGPSANPPGRNGPRTAPAPRRGQAVSPLMPRAAPATCPCPAGRAAMQRSCATPTPPCAPPSPGERLPPQAGGAGGPAPTPLPTAGQAPRRPPRRAPPRPPGPSPPGPPTRAGPRGRDRPGTAARGAVSLRRGGPQPRGDTPSPPAAPSARAPRPGPRRGARRAGARGCPPGGGPASGARA